MYVLLPARRVQLTVNLAALANQKSCMFGPENKDTKFGLKVRFIFLRWHENEQHNKRSTAVDETGMSHAVIVNRGDWL